MVAYAATWAGPEDRDRERKPDGFDRPPRERGDGPPQGGRRPRGEDGPPPGRGPRNEDGPPRRRPGGDGDQPPERKPGRPERRDPPGADDAGQGAVRAGIQWYATWEAAARAARQ